MDSKRGLGRLNPTARLVVFILLSTLFTFSQSWTMVLASFVIGVALLVAGGKYPRAAIFACLSAGVLTFLGNGLFASEDVLFTFLFIHPSVFSLFNGLRLGVRIMAMILPAIAFIAVTPLPEYLDAFRGLHIPASAEMYLTVVLRYVDILWYEIQISMKAMAMRGVNWEGNISEKIPAFRSLMLPLIFRILEHVEGQSLAIDNRGGVNARFEPVEISADSPAVNMQDLFVRYDEGQDASDKHALSDINLEFKRSKTTVLLGRTGAGKTTTMLLCTGLIPHSVGHMKGDVRVFGFNTKQTSLNKLGRLSRIVLTSAVQGLVGLKVKDELAISLRVSKLTAEEYPGAMLKALQIVGLNESFLERQTLRLSGGEMQRVALASAIVAQPLLLALDDVTMQLDPRGKREVVAALNSLLEAHITTVISDAHVDLLENLGDRFISLQDGHIQQDSNELTPKAVRQAGLRVPQLWQLGEYLGMQLPTQVEAAVPLIRNLVPKTPPQAKVSTPPSTEEIMVRVNHLTYTYPNGPTAVKDLDLEFRKGEFVAILGSNGSGKSTTALLLAGAMKPSAGEVLIEGEPFDSSEHRGYIGYVFQEPGNQMVTMKVADELAFGPHNLGWEEDRVGQAVQREMARFGLSPDVVPLNLQPAAARKVSIAATLTMEPRMIILDEPTNNLDVDDVTQLMDHLKNLQAEGTTVVLITHDIEVALAYADRLMVISNGAILIEGPTREVVSHPDILMKSDVVLPPIVKLSLDLWPDHLPALTVEELASWLGELVHSATIKESRPAARTE